MRVVVALGGNALLRRGEQPDAQVQRDNVDRAVESLALIAQDHEVVITHGNGPQVGVLALQSASDPRLSTPYPFDVLGAQTQGMIGYWLLQSLQNTVPHGQVAAVINQTLVSAADPALTEPTKFIGETYDRATAVQLQAERGWTIRQDGQHWRRVVGSPKPLRVVETRIIRRLVEAGVMVVCAGGGGVPVIRNEDGQLQGIEAVVDKDATAASLAESLDADALLILTDVKGVYRNFGTEDAEMISRSTPGALRRELLPEGSMGPKVESAAQFVELTGGFAGIGTLTEAAEILQQRAGTTVTTSVEEPGAPV
ncbi:carbamate kinase [Nesterenkonia alkaliphila]|uniref:Carbamate kinase n=1 Tax=Nesterenkonia alkaliphila TaxID=1463631 RepID=A0A7K1UF14_9MICC|nr:carbamate kinase [Nesterenkonia alkaliphila]MVT25039.1 carbamate kinase [Nesterenkonia alkaliphila]GFZ99849.1 carbamate kinase [Nesterenkonia alkaliphila]